MARDEFTPYLKAGRVRISDVEDSVQSVLDFANETLTPDLWAELERQDGIARCDEDGVPSVRLGWLLRDPGIPPRWSLRRGRAGLDVTLKLQRELCDVLGALVQDDVTPAERFVESGGRYRCRIVEQDEPANARGTDRKTARRRAEVRTRTWQLTWEPTRTHGPRAILLSCMDDVLRYAARIERCERCDSFYLRSGRWATRKRRFCSDRCSLAFHNAAKVAAKSAARKRKREEPTEG